MFLEDPEVTKPIWSPDHISATFHNTGPLLNLASMYDDCLCNLQYGQISMVIFEIYVCCQLNIALCKLKLCLQASSLLLHAPSSSVAQRTTIVTPRYRSSFKFRFVIFPFFSLGPQLRHQGVNPLQVFVSTFPLFLSSSLPPASPSSHGGISSGDLLNSQTGQNHPDYLYQ